MGCGLELKDYQEGGRGAWYITTDAQLSVLSSTGAPPRIAVSGRGVGGHCPGQENPFLLIVNTGKPQLV